MKYYAVIDTNVLISAMLKEGSLPWMIIEQVNKGTIVPLLNDEIINEYYEVSKRNEFGFDDLFIENIVGLITNKSISLERLSSDEKIIDEGDVVFYEIVLSGRQKYDAYLVTGNIKHFPKKPFIVTPREMLETIGIIKR